MEYDNARSVIFYLHVTLDRDRHCNTADRYTWRHDSILLALCTHIRSMRNEGRAALRLGRKRGAAPTKFMSDEGKKLVAPPTSQSLECVLPLFEESDDWDIQFDVNVELDGQVKNRPFSAHIAASPRPDGLVFSNKLKKVVWIELTSPWEENLTKSYTSKKAKYKKLETMAKENGWEVVALYVEVGSRVYINDTWGQMSKALGMKKSQSKALRKSCSRIAL